MVNLRYHIVSLVAVFLALGMGVLMGSTVIDRGIVDNLNRRVNTVEESVRRTRAENRRLSAELEVSRDFAEQALDHLLRGRLRDVRVLLVAVEGIDRKPVESLRQALTDAQATVEGTLWFTTKMRLDTAGDARALAEALGVAAGQPDEVRTRALARVGAALSGAGVEPNPLAALSQAGFLGFDAPSGPGVTRAASPVSLPAPGTRVILVSGAGALVGDDQLSVPLAQILVADRARLLAAEAGQDSPGGRAVFVGLLRKDAEAGPGLSTIDHLESPMGEAAAVLALDDLGSARTGHFGVGPGAQRLLPTIRP